MVPDTVMRSEGRSTGSGPLPGHCVLPVPGAMEDMYKNGRCEIASAILEDSVYTKIYSKSMYKGGNAELWKFTNLQVIKEI